MSRAARFLARLDRAELGGLLTLAAFVLAVSFVPLAVSFAVTPEDIESGRVQLSPPCPYKASHGRECASCGLTRGFSAMSHGRIADARRYNAGAPWLYLGFWLLAGASATSAAVVVRRLAALGNTRGSALTPTSAGS